MPEVEISQLKPTERNLRFRSEKIQCVVLNLFVYLTMVMVMMMISYEVCWLEFKSQMIC